MPRDRRTLGQAADELRSPADRQVPGAAGRDIDVPLLDGHPVRRLDHAGRDLSVQSAGEHPGEAGRHVLDDDRRRAVVGIAGKQRAQRLHAAGRGGDRGNPAVPAEAFGGPHGAARLLKPVAASGGQLDHRRQSAVVEVAHDPQSARGLGIAVDRPQRERAHRRLGAGGGVRRHHDDRRRPQPHDLFEEGQAVHPRHLDVERHDVGIELADHRPRLDRGGGGADHLDLRIAAQQRGDDAAHRRRIVDDEGAHRHAGTLRNTVCPTGRSIPAASPSNLSE